MVIGQHHRNGGVADDLHLVANVQDRRVTAINYHVAGVRRQVGIHGISASLTQHVIGNDRTATGRARGLVGRSAKGLSGSGLDVADCPGLDKGATVGQHFNAGCVNVGVRGQTTDIGFNIARYFVTDDQSTAGLSLATKEIHIGGQQIRDRFNARQAREIIVVAVQMCKAIRGRGRGPVQQTKVQRISRPGASEHLILTAVCRSTGHTHQAIGGHLNHTTKGGIQCAVQLGVVQRRQIHSAGHVRTGVSIHLARRPTGGVIRCHTHQIAIVQGNRPRLGGVVIIRGEVLDNGIHQGQSGIVSAGIRDALEARVGRYLCRVGGADQQVTAGVNGIGAAVIRQIRLGTGVDQVAGQGKAHGIARRAGKHGRGVTVSIVGQLSKNGHAIQRSDAEVVQSRTRYRRI